MPALLCHSSLICGGSTDLQLHHHSRELQIPSGGRCSDIRSRFSGYGLVEQSRGRRKLRQSRGEEEGKFRGGIRASSWFNLSGTSEVMEMEPIKDCDELDQILEEANKQSQPILIDWMAAWCRKCIYLKPKLEKMAAEYVSKIKFYVVDVNNVPQALVKRGNISKMPTIQIWKDGELKAEVIGGHKAWLVVDEVKEMVQKFI